MNMDNVEAAYILTQREHYDAISKTYKDKPSWSLNEWNSYFDKGEYPAMTSEEMAAAAQWLLDHTYPIPTDCPRRPERQYRDGGCPEFRPACMMTGICRVARGMCDTLTNNAVCPTCKRIFSTEGLRDEISRREFKISGMCQRCQDEVFGQ